MDEKLIRSHGHPNFSFSPQQTKGSISSKLWQVSQALSISGGKALKSIHSYFFIKVKYMSTQVTI